MNRTIRTLLALLLAAGLLAACSHQEPTPLPDTRDGVKTRAQWIVTDRLNVENAATFTGPATFGEAVTMDHGLTVSSGAVSLPTAQLEAAEIADVARSVNIPLLSWFECTTDAGTAIGWGETADTLPDFINSSTNGQGATLRFDDTGGQQDTAYICSTVVIPPDYASSPALVIRAKKDAHTGANSEVINCQAGKNGGALGARDIATIGAAPFATYTCEPTIANAAAGDTLQVTLYITSSGTIDDIVDIYSTEFLYTAGQ